MKWQSSSMRQKTLWLSWGCWLPGRHGRVEESQKCEPNVGVIPMYLLNL